MTSSWIAKNPSVNVRNKGLSVAMPDAEFEDVMRSIVHVSSDTQNTNADPFKCIVFLNAKTMYLFTGRL